MIIYPAQLKRSKHCGKYRKCLFHEFQDSRNIVLLNLIMLDKVGNLCILDMDSRSDQLQVILPTLLVWHNSYAQKV